MVATNNLINQDEWLFGWDTTPGIVSVWADRTGKALVWQRTPEGGLRCYREEFRPWLFAATLADLAHLGSVLTRATPAEATDQKLTFSYQPLAGPAENTFRFLLSASDGRALEREIIKGARKRLNQEINGLRDLGDNYYWVGPIFGVWLIPICTGFNLTWKLRRLTPARGVSFW
jgi:DNA polymerase I